MATFRQNHSRHKGGTLISFRLLFLSGLLLVVALLGYPFLKSYFEKLLTPQIEDIFGEDVRTYIPSHSGELVHHRFFSLSYIEQKEQSEWVAYELTHEMIKDSVQRYGFRFSDDHKVTTGSANYYDYSGSSYERGHLVAAADMRFDSVALKESFYMSNIAPMRRSFNNGIWRELEIQIRNWTYRYPKLYIISGPIWKSNSEIIGKKRNIHVPQAFYKVVLTQIKSEWEAIGFIIPHDVSSKPLEDYMVTVDDVEAATGIDFFVNMFSPIEQNKFESQYNQDLWKINPKQFHLRTRYWNFE